MKKVCGMAGFTLIETIVALGLSSIVAVALLSMYHCAYSIFECQLFSTDIQYAERAAMQMIIDDLMAAQKVEYLDDHSKLCLNINGVRVTYFLRDQTVYRGEKINMPVANDISKLSFQPDLRSGCTAITIEAEYGKKRTVCAARPRLWLRAAPVGDSGC